MTFIIIVTCILAVVCGGASFVGFVESNGKRAKECVIVALVALLLGLTSWTLGEAQDSLESYQQSYYTAQNQVDKLETANSHLKLAHKNTKADLVKTTVALKVAQGDLVDTKGKLLDAKQMTKKVNMQVSILESELNMERNKKSISEAEIRSLKVINESLETKLDAIQKAVGN